MRNVNYKRVWLYELSRYLYFVVGLLELIFLSGLSIIGERENIRKSRKLPHLFEEICHFRSSCDFLLCFWNLWNCSHDFKHFLSCSFIVLSESICKVFLKVLVMKQRRFCFKKVLFSGPIIILLENSFHITVRSIYSNSHCFIYSLLEKMYNLG